MKNILRSALVLGALVSTPVIAMADPTPTTPSGDKAPADNKPEAIMLLILGDAPQPGK